MVCDKNKPLFKASRLIKSQKYDQNMQHQPISALPSNLPLQQPSSICCFLDSQYQISDPTIFSDLIVVLNSHAHVAMCIAMPFGCDNTPKKIKVPHAVK